MQPTPKEKRIRILKRLFSGETYRSVSMKEDRSISTVSAIFNEFVNFASSTSLEKAAEHYGVQEEIASLMDLARDAKKTNLSFPELLGGARLLLLMKKLGLNSTQLEDAIHVLESYKEKFGDFIESALKFAELEKETGKSPSELIEDYQKLRKELQELSEKIRIARLQGRKEQKKATLKLQLIEDKMNEKISLLTGQIQTREISLAKLEKKADSAQTILNNFNGIRDELKDYGLEFVDFSTVRKFLANIQKLDGDPSKAVNMIKECGSLEDKLSQLKTDIEADEGKHQSQQQLHEIAIKKLEIKKKSIEDEITKREKKSGTLRNENIKLMEEITKQQIKRQQLALQVDGLQKALAERLKVQPDIDEIMTAIPRRKQELHTLEEEIGTLKPVLSVGIVIQNILQKKPFDRKTMIHWLEQGASNRWETSDEMARKAITELLAKEGYVPESKLKQVSQELQDKIKKAEEDVQIWVRRARKKSEKLIECEQFIREVNTVIEKQKNDELCKRAADLLASILPLLDSQCVPT